MFSIFASDCNSCELSPPPPPSPFGPGVPQTHSELECANAPVFTCASRPRRRRRLKEQTDRQMEVGMEGRLKKGRRRVSWAVSSSACCMWLLCNYCRSSVSTVLLHYMKDSYLLCPEGAFFPPHLYYIRYLKKKKKSKSIPA